ncbi:hypothetical protein HZ989_11230 [Brevundimonas sp. AJA228-03]|uniref:hypothetical protein n=1 Tax=Brevundimonas sp. AJA228-03 TaxID=2752515 RepID=UPI001ADFC6CF|nr:hypothetical protein [Brevundimonas sp. AJA228-03]QTN18809.1 hypothetical protein HZ989_11230 [Brevundimonas sp. AJA228-03]
MLDTLYLKIAMLPMIGVAIFAFVKGDGPERHVMGTYLLGWLAGLILQDDGQLYQDFQWILFLLDVAMAGTFAFIVWQSRRAWVTWALAIQLLVVMSHIVYLFDVRPPVAAFYTVLNLASYGILLTIGIGTFWAWQERRAAGLE